MAGKKAFSRMRSEGFPFSLGVWGLDPCSRCVARVVAVSSRCRRGVVAGGSLILWLLGAAIQRVSGVRVYGRFAWQACGIVAARACAALDRGLAFRVAGVGLRMHVGVWQDAGRWIRLAGVVNRAF